MRLIRIIAIFSGRSAAAGVVGVFAVAIFAWPDSVANPAGPLGRLDRRAIPAPLRPPDPPSELVAVLGQVGGPVTEELCSVAVSADGRWIVIGTRGGEVRLHEVPSLSVRWARAGHTRRVTALDFAPDGRSLISAAADGRMRRWTIDGEPMSDASDNRSPWPETCIVHAPDGRTVATGCFGRVRLWNLEDKSLAPVEEVLIPGCQLRALAFSPDARTLACGGGGHNAIRLIRVGADRLSVETVLPGSFENRTRALAFGSRGDLAWLDTEGRGMVRHGSGRMSTWRIPCPSCHAAVFARDGQHLLTVHGTGRVYVWRLPRAWTEL
jgi:WD40 repeat protein